MEVLDYSIFPEKPVVYAGFWTRFAASFIDGVILIIAGTAIKVLMLGGQYGFVDALVYGGSVRATFINLILGWLYNALQESSPQMATLGKRAMKIRVTDLNGGRISFGQATGRHFGKFLSSLILAIGYLMMLWDDRRQTLHDRLAGTLVVQN